MNYLLFFITSIFSFILFVFYKLNSGINIFSGNTIYNTNLSSLTGNIFIDSVIFLILAVFLFLYFSIYSFKKTKKQDNLEEHIEEKGEYIEKNNILKKINIKIFFTKYICYIGFILFYISIYLILYSFGIIDFSYIILFLNFIIIVFFFVSHKAEIFKDFIKINTILFSLYYILLYLYIFITGENTLNNIDLINTLFIFSFFIITFYSEYKKRNIEKYGDNSLILYFFIYSFIVFSFYFKLILSDYFNLIYINYSLIFIYISVFLNILIYFILQKIPFFFNSKFILRALSFLFGYISIIFSTIFLIKNINIELSSTFFSILNYFSIIGILIYLIIFNFKIHKLFQNYISLFFSLFGIIFLLNFLIFENISLINGDIANLTLILNFSISFFIIIFTYLYNLFYELDYFFLHICAYLVNLLGIIYYLVFGNFEILNIGIILLLDSILIFLSYFKLKKIQKNI